MNCFHNTVKASKDFHFPSSWLLKSQVYLPFSTASPTFLLTDNLIPAIELALLPPSPVGAGAAFFSSIGALGCWSYSNSCVASSFEISFSETINVSPFTSTSYFSFSPPSFNRYNSKCLSGTSALAFVKATNAATQQVPFVSNSVPSFVGALRFHLNWFPITPNCCMTLCFQDLDNFRSFLAWGTLESSTSQTQFPLKRLWSIRFLINLVA